MDALPEMSTLRVLQICHKPPQPGVDGGCLAMDSLTQSLQSEGHDVKVLNTLRFAIDLSGDDPDLQFRGKQLSDYDAILPRIGNSITYFGTAVVRQFEQMDVYTPNTANGISNARDKLRATQILSRHNIGMPATTFVRNRADVPVWVQLWGSQSPEYLGLDEADDVSRHFRRTAPRGGDLLKRRALPSAFHIPEEGARPRLLRVPGVPRRARREGRRVVGCERERARNPAGRRSRCRRGLIIDRFGARTTTSLGNHAWLRSSGCWKLTRM